MTSKDHFEKQERAARMEARGEAHRTGNYRFDAFKTLEIRDQKPHNCYGCSWERQQDGKMRLKFPHKLCYPQHVKEEAK